MKATVRDVEDWVIYGEADQQRVCMGWGDTPDDGIAVSARQAVNLAVELIGCASQCIGIKELEKLAEELQTLARRIKSDAWGMQQCPRCRDEKENRA
jgi:hypothetical protein